MAIGTVAAIALGAGALGSAAISSGASGKAAKAATQAADQSAAVQREIYGQNKDLLAPYVDTGSSAMGQVNALLGIDDGSGNYQHANDAFARYRAGTGYDWRVKQGMNALNGQFAGSRVLRSGAAIKGAVDYGQNQASQEFGNYLSALGNQQGLGLTAGGALAGVGTNYANSLTAINSNKADAIGNSALLNAQNVNSLIGGLSSGILKYGMK